MKNKGMPFYKWNEMTIGITGASGTLGKSLTKKLRYKGAFVVGLTSKDISNKEISETSPNQWVKWECGEEHKLDNYLSKLDIIILNHGVNYQGSQGNNSINKSLEINALSTLRIIERFETIAKEENKEHLYREIWVNTSEAEVQPALSPTYEISKRLLGQLVSIKMRSLFRKTDFKLNIRKLILGPFKSDLNPLGLMDSDFVAEKIINLAELNLNLIIVTPNPITYILIPLTELSRFIYYYLTNKFCKKK
tara:strand:- start:844 stop:1593 length:750 start_codon:yes stop_codon:yes gene_type:complete